MEPDRTHTEIITENGRSERDRRELENPTAIIKGTSPICGDEIPLQIRKKDGIIEDASFTGIGCAISQASTSVMIGLIKGKTRGEAMHLAETFLSMIKEDGLSEGVQDGLEDIAVFQNTSKLPARVKYVVPAWRTLEEAIQSDGSCPGDNSASCKARI